MNVLILSTHFHTGGITRYILTLTKGLARRGNRIFVVSAGGNCVEHLSQFAGMAQHQSMNIRTKSELDLRIYWALPALQKFIRENTIDIIHSQTRVTQVMGTFLALMTRKPYVSTAHGFFKKRLSRKIFPCWGERVIAVSEPVREHLIKDLGVPGQKIAIVPNGIDVNDFLPIDDQERKKLRQKYQLMDDPVIGIIARLSSVKGIDVLVAAMKKVSAKKPQAKLLIVGQGPEEPDLKAMVGKLRLERNVFFYPIVDKTAEILALLDVFVMPSRQEGLGLSIMEAQAAGVPVVASKVGGIPSLIEDGRNGLLVSPENPESLAQAILLLLENKEQAKKMGEAGRAFVGKHFSDDKMIEGTLKVYSDARKLYAPR